jgi:D-amino-acid dehydrogenase
MRVAIIGAGVVGVTTAWELAAQGHEVTVFERRGSVAAEGSFANAGIVSPAHVVAWGALGIAGGGDGGAGFSLAGRLDASALAWKWRLARGAAAPHRVEARAAVLRLARVSLERTRGLARDLGMDYESSEGCLVLLRSKRALAEAREALSLLAEWGLRFSLLDAARCREVEPGLNPDTLLQAGVHLPDSQVGNCRQFTTLLRAEAQRLGARFLFHTQVHAIRPGATPEVEHGHAEAEDATRASHAPADDDGRDGPPTQPMPVETRSERFDAVVVCASLGAVPLLRPLGLKLRLAPVWGHSVTAPLRRHEAHPDVGPRSAIIDGQRGVSISRIGQRVRVSGSVEIGGAPQRISEKALDALYRALDDWFPGSTQLSQVQRWKGLQPRLPDGVPIVGRTRLDGILLNLGHGSAGWALACGCAGAIANTLAGRDGASGAQVLDGSRLC